MIQIPLGTLPLMLVCIWDGNICFVKRQAFFPIFDQPEEGVGGMIDMEGIHIEDTTYEYNVAYAYKSMPLLLSWLKQQNLIMPKLNKG